MLKELLHSQRLQVLEQLLHLNQQTVLIEGLWNSPKALIAALAQQVTGKNVLIITGASQEEARLFHDFPFFTACPVFDFPAWETLPSENIAPSPDIVGERYGVLRTLANSKDPLIILTGLQACLQHLITPQDFKELCLSLKPGDNILLEELTDKLLLMGYQQRSIAADKGEFALRQGLIDIFPVTSPDPYRIEFRDNIVEMIRIYDPIGQISISPATTVHITPACELELLSRYAKHASILDYLSSNTIVIFDDIAALEDRSVSLTTLAAPSRTFSSFAHWQDMVKPLQKILLSQQPIENLSAIEVFDDANKAFYSQKTILHDIGFELFQTNWRVQRWRHPFQTVMQCLQPEIEQATGAELLASLSNLSAKPDMQLHFLSANELDESNLRKRLADGQIKLPHHTFYHRGYLSNGMMIEDLECMLMPFTEITHRYKIRRQKLRSTYHTTPYENYELLPGEFVVHIQHGIGRYLKMEKQTNHLGISSEFFVIEYAEGSKLFVPLSQMHLITKYVGANEIIPKLHTLGSPRWKKMRQQTEQAIVGYASELLQNYAQRSMQNRTPYPGDSAWQKAFEENFPFEETEDQLMAIANIKNDLCSSKAMDRLICGDVGYGKTEVAMRAAFKAVMDGNKQVAVLAPTTVLAMQHYESFLERMDGFPISIGILSRFQSAKEIKTTLEGVAQGTINIVIGTHRLISADVKFNNLGLIIIDEEQRFGVKAKEHLRTLKQGADCIALSATPIPRTLYMSLMGAKDMSLINTPPQDRLPIKSVIAQKHDQVLKNALLRELARDGQAFVVHNRVDTIYDLADRIKTLLPQARVLVAHGQMQNDEIDSAFHAFKNGRADILVATTIIENGIDIPNANTIIIDRADQYGLATLYQMRGRVGRWNRRAYAYFLVSNSSTLSESAQKRLHALANCSSYGGGMRIAMLDLELRGAGDILGEKQSGHVRSIGFYLYCKLLKRAMRTLQGQSHNAAFDTRIELPIEARLPENYVNEVTLRMEIYQRLGESSSLEEVDAIWHELIDRFGPPPQPTLWLYHLTRIRVLASLQQITLIKQDKSGLIIETSTGKNITRKLPLLSYKTPQAMEKDILHILNGSK